MIVIQKWPGLITNASPYALPPGAAVTQVNVQARTPGALIVRDGMTGVAFASVAAGTAAIQRAIRAPCGGQERIVYQDAAGAVRVAAGPS
jgi:hypothetical protein